MRSGDMAVMRVAILIFLLSLTGLVRYLFGQSPARVWATTSVSQETVNRGEPVMVTVVVYTSTWFTNAPSFGELDIRGALVSRLSSRNNSLSKSIGGENYSGVRQQFVVYPTVTGETSIPSITVFVESPDEGDYKAKQRRVSTQERTFMVNEPEGADGVLVARDLRVSDSWSGTLADVKLGDIRERTITRTAVGPVAALMPPITLVDTAFASVYLGNVALGDEQSGSAFVGRRKEIFIYVFDEVGKFDIAPVELPWYDSRSNSLQTAFLAGKEVVVVDNPDLAFARTMQDSLQKLLATREALKERKAPIIFLGLRWWQWLVIVVGLSLLIIRFRATMIQVFRRIAVSMAPKIDREEVLFRQVLRTELSDAGLYHALNAWYMAYKQVGDRDSLEEALGAFKAGAANHYLALAASLYRSRSMHVTERQQLRSYIKEFRERSVGVARKNRFTLNPAC